MQTLPTLRSLAPCALLLLASACSNSPRNKQSLPPLGKGVEFSGFSVHPNDTVSVYAVEAKSATPGKAQPVTRALWVAGTTSSTTPQKDGAGNNWYPYSKSVDLPNGYENYLTYWAPGSPSNENVQIAIQVRSALVDGWLTTFEQESHPSDPNGCIKRYASGIDAINNCKSPESPVATLRASCGAPDSFCCMKSAATPSLNGDDHCQSGAACQIDGVCRTKNWPSASNFSALADFPDDEDYDWTNDINGIASSGQYWFVSNAPTGTDSTPDSTNICRLPAGALHFDCSLVGLKRNFMNTPALPSGYDHLSNMDFYDGILYAGAFDTKDGARPDVVAVFTPELVSRPYVTLDKDEQFLAIHKQTGRLYTLSKSSPKKLGVYRRRFSGTQLILDKEATVPLYDTSGNGFTRERYQGGKFSPTGKLYISFDERDHKRGGVFVFNVGPKLGKQIMRLEVLYQDSAPDEHKEQELQDILIESIASGPYAGDLHAVLLNNDWGDADNFWFKHYKISDRSKL